MSNMFNLEKHSALRNVSSMAVICQPLAQHFSISYFNHIRQFPDNSRICLTNQGDWVKHVCEQKLYLVAPFEECKMEHQPGHMFWLSYQDNPVYQSALTHFNIAHSITIIEKCDKYTDFYHFGSAADTQFKSEYYLQLLDALKLFILYYKEKAHKLIITSERLNFTELMAIHDTVNTVATDTLLSVQHKQAFLEDIKIQRFYFGDELLNQYLTSRELECVRWLAIGKSAEEIATILDITPRTTIAHINNIKDKFGCTKVSQLIFKLSLSQASELLLSD